MHLHVENAHTHPRDCGHCAACRFWQSDDHDPEHDRSGLCEQPELVHFQLQVSDDSGCSRFTPTPEVAS